MAAENGVDLSGFIVDKGKEVDEEDRNEEIAEISLSPDLEAEEARKEELRLQAQKVKHGPNFTADTSYKPHKKRICSLDAVPITS